jgi:hypothetical protein
MHINLNCSVSLLAVLLSAGYSPASEPEPLKIPPRDPKARPELIDLSAHYNAALTDSWHPASNMAGETGNDLAELPGGVQKLDGIEFDLRGLIHKATQANGLGLQLFRRPWDNPRPDVLIESIDFSACKAGSIPFLIAITAESPRKP